MPALPGIVGGHTGIVARMTSSHGLNAEDTHACAGLGDHNAIVGIDTTAVLCPGHIDGQITLVDGTGGGHHVQFIDALLTELKGNYLGQNLDGLRD